MQEEVTQKTIALSMKTGKLTAQVLQMALKKFLEAQKHGPKLHQGQQSLKQLKQHGAALSNIEITDANITAFKPCAKKYGVDFTLRKDKTTQPPHYIVIFKSRDADNLEQASPIYELNGSRMSSLTLYLSIACCSRSSPKVRCFSFSLMKIRLSLLPPEAINLGTTVSSASSSVV